jgi:hypothetical protein
MTTETEERTGGGTVNPPYVAYKTFRNFLDSLRVTMPSRIDRSVMHTLSGGAQSHLMHALKSMGLISANGLPSDTLKELVVPEEDRRRRAMLTALRAGFPFLFEGAIDLSTASGKQLMEQFASVTLGASTTSRAIAFFLASAKDAGLPLSPYFKRIQSRSASSGRRSANGNGSNRQETLIDEADAVSDKEEDKPIIGESLTVALKSGGTLTVSASTSFFKMSAEDRTFVFGIIDQLQHYDAE